MTHKEEAVQLFLDGFLCAQSVLAAFSEECGLTEEQALRLGTCFGTGMKKGEVCGACTGALMVLGLMFGQDDVEDGAGRLRAYIANDKMTERFAESCGTYLCREILQCNPGTEEGLAYARKNGLFVDICPDVIGKAVDILEEIIKETEQTK